MHESCKQDSYRRLFFVKGVSYIDEHNKCNKLKKKEMAAVATAFTLKLDWESQPDDNCPSLSDSGQLGPALADV